MDDAQEAALEEVQANTEPMSEQDYKDARLLLWTIRNGGSLDSELVSNKLLRKLLVTSIGAFELRCAVSEVCGGR